MVKLKIEFIADSHKLPSRLSDVALAGGDVLEVTEAEDLGKWDVAFVNVDSFDSFADRFLRTPTGEEFGTNVTEVK
jgi:hypothetical protein